MLIKQINTLLAMKFGEEVNRESNVVDDESIISVFNIIFESILFIFDFVLFNIISFLELFYFNCKLLYFKNKYLKD